MANWLQRQWASITYWHLLLMPLSWVFGAIVFVRKFFYTKAWLKSYRLSVPVVVVGNINVGGTGKTPLVIWLAEQLKLAGHQPGIISRGYGGDAEHIAEVTASSHPQHVGDEPVLIAMRTGCPVFIGADRVATGEALLETYPDCTVIISDDGLQHYRLQRDVEIVVFDGVKGFGNGALLPAGPLRESQARLKTVDVLVSNGKAVFGHLVAQKPIEMFLESAAVYNLVNHQLKLDLSTLVHKKIIAIAGIGNPERFFQQLRLLGLDFQSRAYSDHYVFQASDFEDIKADVILMTEKDAVKCTSFAKPNFWALPVNAVIHQDLLMIIIDKLNKLRK